MNRNRLGKHLFYFNFGKNIAFGPISMIMQSITLVGVWKLPAYMIIVISIIGTLAIYSIGYILDRLGIRTGFKNAEYKNVKINIDKDA